MIRQHFVFTLLLTALAASCGPEDLVVTVNLSGLPADARIIEAVLHYGDREARVERLDRGQADYFGLRLPDDASGAITIELSGLDDKDCVVGRDSLSAELGADRRVRLKSQLKPMEPPLCRLTVDIEGAGKVVTSPAADCRQRDGLCQLEFARGTAVSIDAVADSGVRFNGWTDPCGAPNTCLLTMNVTQPLLTARFAPLICSADHVCWEAPLPQGQDLNATWGNTNTDAWAVGDGGTILHWDRQHWSNTPSGIGKRLLGVWAATAGAAWAVGEGPTLLRWNGTAWRPDTQLPMRLFDQLFAIWGVTETNVWTVGSYGSILHWDGTSWQRVDGSTMSHLYAITGTSASDIWVVGDSGTVRYFNGTTWKIVATGIMESLYGAVALEPGRVLAVGNAGTVVRCVPTGCTPLVSMVSEKLYGVTVHGTGAWVVGEGGVALQVTGNMVTKMDSGTTASLHGVTGSAVPWAVGSGGALIHSSDMGWLPLQPYTSDTLSSVYASSERDIRAITQQGDLLHWNGYLWSTEHLGLMGGAQTRTLRGAVGRDLMILSKDGSTQQLISDRWTASPALPSTSVIGMARPSAKIAFAMTQTPRVLWQWDGSLWKVLTPTAGSSSFGDPRGIFALDGNTVWVACDGGVIVRGDISGSQVQWRASNVGFNVTMTAVWGASATALWAIGQSGLILSSTDGLSWTRVFTTATADLTAIHGSDSTHVWAVGAEGAVLHFDGTDWQLRHSGASHTLRDVRALPSGEAIIVGDHGTILHAR